MTVPYKNIALVGVPSGNIGRIILDGLLRSPAFNITVLSRKESKVTFPPGVSVHHTDFSDDDLEAAFQGQEVVISALGAAGFTQQKTVVDAAIRAGVQRFLPSEFSANSQDDAVLQLLPLFNVKRELLEYLKTKESHSFSWTGLATGPLFDWKSFTATNEKQLGEAVVSILQQPDTTRNRFLYIGSVETTQREILDAVERETGVAWTVNNTTTEAQVAEGVRKLGAGDFTGAFALVRATTYGNTPGLRANFARDEALANDLLGIKLEGVQDIVKRVCAE